MTSPSVAVLGAGPSGLAAAKALLEYGLVPVVFEAGASLGGMWQGPERGAWSDFAQTNISRYSCIFSDLAWPDDVEVFPVRRDLVHYLELYADRHDLRRHIRFGTRVTAVRPVAEGRWRVDWSASADSGSAVFANVLVGSGFFSVPFRPPLPGLTDFGGDVLHSAECGSAAALRAQCTGKRVLVVGASFSGTEIASELSPYARVTVTLRHPMWFVPRWVSATNDGPRYPLDLVIYSRRADNPLLLDPHLFLRRVGGDPGAVSPELAFDRDSELPLAFDITDDFLDLVRDNAIAVKRSAALHFDAGGVTFADGTRQEMDAVILCTGFAASLPYFDPSVLDTLDFDPTDQLQPTLLHRDMFHPDLPGLAFIGHYRGPYLPVMELQSRWVARILAGELPMPDRTAMQAGIEEARRLRAQVPRPQFPHGDFVGLADSLAREVGVYPELEQGDPLWARLMQGPLVPAHYRLIGSHAEPGPAREVIAATPAPILDDPAPSGPATLARRVLDLLRGHWTIERQIEPGGSFSGTAEFTQRSTDSLLYHESGRIVLDDGTMMDGQNSYIYAQRNDAIELSFVDGRSRGMHFFDISLPQDGTADLPILSVDQHLCRRDTYDVTFRFEKPELFTLTYVVRGPKKSYVSRSTYRRVERSA